MDGRRWMNECMDDDDDYNDKFNNNDDDDENKIFTIHNVRHWSRNSESTHLCWL
jgi:hypothetical protein